MTSDKFYNSIKEPLEQLSDATRPKTITHVLKSLKEYGFSNDNYVLNIKEIDTLHHLYNLDINLNEYYDILVKYSCSNDNELSEYYTNINHVEIFEDICISTEHNLETFWFGVTITRKPYFKVNKNKPIKGCIWEILFTRSK